MFTIISPILFALTILVLGLLTPGYNHINHTISRLAIEKYGWIQSVNFLQLTVALFLTGEKLAASMARQTSRIVVRRTFSLTAFLAVFSAFIPTDPIENVRFSFQLVSPTGALHVGIVLLLLFIAPFGISRLAQTFTDEPYWRNFARPTRIMGFAAFTLSIIWFFMYAAGFMLEYRGLFQKLIAVIPLLWFLLITRRIHAL